ncbi:hypothetical protein GO988_04020 [Hymenobacter sp. HMF4947]|uniref:N-acetyltransferase domain-containing protein n=1 Tax=Hymenobacter ginkgonis TaxID=2682976 RepID=A0A7K1TAQ8_9BACT|nr:GNAT family N-acetyltransferase [Hymenobacter ginkgonis]MVN75484.1 hypothetical protein [Hymenobacter ginkgonis]
MPDFALRVAQAADAPALADLANQYTYQQLSETERQGGFLTGSFAAPALQAMLASVPGQVAYNGQELVGFLINSKLPAERYPPLVQEISQLLPRLFYRERPLAQYRWFFYGPVVVKQEYRGQGLLQQLFQASKRELAGRFDLGIAFIAEENTASLRLHTQKLGLEVVGKLTFEGTAYVLLVFSVG